MNSSQFMDKQILGLSGSGGGGGEFFDLMDPQEDRSQADKEEILPSYDFHPIRTVAGLDGPKPPWGSADSKIGGSALKYAGISEPCELAKVSHEKEKGAHDVVTVAEIDHTMKKHADNLLHALEGVSSRLSQLEIRTRHLETSVDELKVSVGNNNGSTDGKLRQLENILREVQTSVQVLCNKQEIAKTQLELSKLQTSKAEDQPSPMTNTGQLDTKQQTLSPLTQPIQPTLQQPVIPPPPPSLPAQPAPNAPPPPPPQQNPLPGQFPPQVMQSQIPSLASLPRESYFPPPSQPTEAAHQQYQIPLSQQPQQLQQPQHYQSPPRYSQPPPHPPQPINPPPQLQPPLPHHSEESSPYMPAPVTYPPGIRQPSPLNQPSTGPPPQQFYGPNPSMYEPPSSRPSSGQHSFSSGYGPPVRPNFSDSYPNSGSPSHYSSSMKTSPFAASGASFGGSSSYPHPPTAQILPQAQPTGSGSGGPAGNRVPIDDVVDKVATMGFSRDQVRATVRKLTENGQSVDLNVVLDKLTNDGQIQPQKGWFGQ